MSEYELYNRIFAPKLKHEMQSALIEKMEKKTHWAEIVSDKKTTYTVYRYDQKEQGELFFPFFNNTHNGEHGAAECPAPEDLLKFCDYILLAERKGVLYVLLIEMKSGANGDAGKQLDATETFMEFIKASAARVSEANGYAHFDADNVKIRKIVLKPAPKARPMTNVSKSKQNDVDVNASPIYFQRDQLPLYLFCRNK